MQWLVNNWGLVLIVLLMVGMHLFGHGGHGGHASHSNKSKKPDKSEDD